MQTVNYVFVFLLLLLLVLLFFFFMCRSYRRGMTKFLSVSIFSCLPNYKFIYVSICKFIYPSLYFPFTHLYKPSHLSTKLWLVLSRCAGITADNQGDTGRQVTPPASPPNPPPQYRFRGVPSLPCSVPHPHPFPPADVPLIGPSRRLRTHDGLFCAGCGRTARRAPTTPCCPPPPPPPRPRQARPS